MPCGATAASMAVGGVPGLLSLGSAGAEWAEGRHQGKAGARESWTSERTGRPARACPTLSNHCLCQPHPCQLCTGQPHLDRPRTKAAHSAALPVLSGAGATLCPCKSPPLPALHKTARWIPPLHESRAPCGSACAKRFPCQALPVPALHKTPPHIPPSHKSRAPCGPARANPCPGKSPPVPAMNKPAQCRPPSHNSRAPCGPVRAKRCPCKSRAKPCPC